VPEMDDMALVPKKPLRPRPPVAAAISATYLDSFIAYVADECHLADNTVAAYRRDTARFFKWLQARPVVALNVRDLADYVGWLNELKLKPVTRKPGNGAGTPRATENGNGGLAAAAP
jgi:Phage integrase, N-terminal SAM-like domain